MSRLDPHWPFRDRDPDQIEPPTLHRIGWMGDVVLVVALAIGGLIVVIDFLVRGGLDAAR